MILSGLEQDQRAGFLGNDTDPAGLFFKIGVLGTGIKNEATGTKGEDRLVIRLLKERIEIKGYGVYGPIRREGGNDLNIADLSALFAYCIHGVIVFSQGNNGTMAIPFGILRSAQHERR